MQFIRGEGPERPGHGLVGVREDEEEVREVEVVDGLERGQRGAVVVHSTGGRRCDDAKALGQCEYVH